MSVSPSPASATGRTNDWTATGLDYNTLGLLTGRIFSIMDNWVLVALPMFIFMGLMLDKSGVAERMMHSMQKLFGKVRGRAGRSR